MLLRTSPTWCATGRESRTRPDEGVDEPSGVAEVNVLVDESMHEEQGCAISHLGHVVHDAGLIVSDWVGQRGAHVSLGVVRVIAIPVGHRRPGDAHLVPSKSRLCIARSFIT